MDTQALVRYHEFLVNAQGAIEAEEVNGEPRVSNYEIAVNICITAQSASARSRVEHCAPIATVLHQVPALLSLQQQYRW